MVRGLTTLACLAFAAAGCGGGATSPCQAGARTCRGDAVYFCFQGSWALEKDCAYFETCVQGACKATFVTGDPGPDPLADVRADLAEPDPGFDPGVPDPGLPDTSEPDPDQDQGQVQDQGQDPGAEDVVEPEDPGPAPEDDRPDVPVDPGTDEGPSLPDIPTDPVGPGTCGDGVRQGTEQCDGSDVGFASCASLAYGSGTLRCRDDCTYDSLLCGDQSHALVYDKVLNIAVKGRFVDVAWHPKGTYALLAAYSGSVVRYDPPGPGSDPVLTEVGTTGSLVPARVAFAPNGDAYVAAYDPKTVSGTVFHVPDGAGSVSALPGTTQAARFVTLKFAPDGSFALIAGRGSTDSINYVCRFDPTTGTTTKFKGYNAGAGVWDLMFVPPDVLGYLAAILVHGVNGTDAKQWIGPSNELVNAGQPGGFGNMGRAAWRPKGSYGLVSGWSSNVLYTFSGTWDKVYVNQQDIGSGVLEVFFRPDGKRALVLGQPWGQPATLHIVEHRPQGDVLSSADFLAQPISNWDGKPFYASAGTHLTAGAFRPGVSCDEGLMVGDEPVSGTYGMVVRFKDTDYLDCPE
jgi:hypothetical protein